MSKQRTIRRIAMQVLYQYDLRGDKDRDLILEGYHDAPESRDVIEHAFGLADAAWNDRAQADTLSTELAPKWPAHRQPPVDRALLRLGYHEITSGRTPVKVAINEAVELAKKFCGEQSPAFINGVLDKMAKHHTGPTDPEPTDPVPEDTPPLPDTPVQPT